MTAPARQVGKENQPGSGASGVRVSSSGTGGLQDGVVCCEYNCWRERWCGSVSRERGHVLSGRDGEKNAGLMD